MAKKLSDTVALQATPFGGNSCADNQHYSKSVRKIDNGYITSESHNDGLGYRSMETYSADHPDKSSVGGNTDSMARAVEFMKK